MENGLKNKQELDKIFKEIEGEILDNSDFAKEYLEEVGYDLNELNKKGIDFIEKMKGKARLKLAKEKRFKIVEEIKKYLSQLNKDVKMQSRQILIDILKGEQLSFQFRDLEKLSDEDLLEMVKEEQLLQYLEELKKDN
ncbi:MAG: hypothetical protein IH949_08210 [Bacteroidetes bacterium]|nr:hypothetical protein [Bacteroidota bacterium]